MNFNDATVNNLIICLQKVKEYKKDEKINQMIDMLINCMNKESEFIFDDNQSCTEVFSILIGRNQWLYRPK